MTFFESMSLNSVILSFLAFSSILFLTIKPLETLAKSEIISNNELESQNNNQLHNHHHKQLQQLRKLNFKKKFKKLSILNHVDTSKNLEKTYGVIIDCGSSGSRAHIFQWDSYLRYPALLNNIEPLRDDKGEALTMRIKPGLSSLMYNPEHSFEYLSPIIEFIRNSIPKGDLKATSIYVLATAGMRLLDPETQLEIMNDLIEDFRDGDSFASFKTKVISGASEGMYQWITVNSKAKRFKQNDNNESNKTFSLIEMGGASIQVTYQLTEKLNQSIRKQLRSSSSSSIDDHNNHQQELLKAFKGQIIEPKISRQAKEFNYKLVSTTFLGFGSNSARLTYVDLLVNRFVNNNNNNDNNNDINNDNDYDEGNNKFHELKNQFIGLYSKQRPLIIQDPCLPIGSNETVTRPARILTIPAPNNKSNRQTIGFNIEEDDITISVRLEGTGNYDFCYSSLKEMLFRSKNERLNCKPNDTTGCTMLLLNENFIPFNEYEFLGLSDFYYTTKEMMGLNGKYKKLLFIEKTKEICQIPYEKLLILYPEANKFDKSRILRECFKAVWIDVFLSFGLNMPDDYDNFKTIGSIDGDDIDWTLGAVLDNSLGMEIAAEINPDDDEFDYEDEEEDENENDGVQESSSKDTFNNNKVNNNNNDEDDEDSIGIK